MDRTDLVGWRNKLLPDTGIHHPAETGLLVRAPANEIRTDVDCFLSTAVFVTAKQSGELEDARTYTKRFTRTRQKQIPNTRQEHRHFPRPPRRSAVGIQDAHGKTPPRLGPGAFAGGVH